MTKKKIKKAGFSLIELLFAMLFLSVIVFGVIKLQTSNLTLSNTKRLELKAYSYATQGLEVVSAFDVLTISGCAPTCYLKKNGNYSLDNSGPDELESGLFQRSFEHDEATLPGASIVDMTVAWTDSSGDHDVSIKRIISD